MGNKPAVAISHLQAIQRRGGLEKLARRYLPSLRRKGRHFAARCPFHRGRNLTFYVSPTAQTFWCFECGSGGDIFVFMMRIEEIGYRQAVRRLLEAAPRS